MDKKNTSPGNPEAAQAFSQVISDLLREGAQASDLAFCLAFMSLDLALQTSPSPAHATMIVTSGLSFASKAHCADMPEDLEPDVETPRSADESQGATVWANIAGTLTVH